VRVEVDGHGGVDDPDHRAPGSAPRVVTGRSVARGVLATMIVAVVAVGLLVVVRSTDASSAEQVAAASTAGATSTSPVPPTVPPTALSPAPTPSPVPPGPDACAVQADLTAAVADASGAGERSAAALLDTATGAYFAAGEADAPFDTASVVKVFLATELLLTGRMSGPTATTAYTMITRSDDRAANALYERAGGDGVVTALGQHYGIADLGRPPAAPGKWGETTITADGMAHFYAAVRADPAVWPWLSDAMGDATHRGSDGTDQYFGIPSATDDWAVKQGWMVGLGPGTTYNSTGYVDHGRYVVVLLTHGASARYGAPMAATLTAMARDVLPGGLPGGPGPTRPGCPG
jgi:hypothetical protein